MVPLVFNGCIHSTLAMTTQPQIHPKPTTHVDGRCLLTVDVYDRVSGVLTNGLIQNAASVATMGFFGGGALTSTKFMQRLQHPTVVSHAAVYYYEMIRGLRCRQLSNSMSAALTTVRFEISKTDN